MNTAHENLIALCRERGVEIADDNTFLVPSSDGTRKYTVREKPNPDAMDTDIHLWDCNCMAGQHGRMCKHVRLVSEIVEIYDETAGF